MFSRLSNLKYYSRKKFYLILIVGISVIVFIATLAIISLNQKQTPYTANSFVTTFGTYDSSNYKKYAENLKSKLTPRYYNESFSPDAISKKALILSESPVSVATFLTDPSADPEVTIGSDTATAKVFAIESKLDQSKTQTNDPVDYTISYKLVDNKWLVDDVTIYRIDDL